MAKEEVLSALISTGPYDRLVDEIFTLPERKASSYVCFANVHMVIEAYYDETFRQVVNNADVTAPDGRPVSLFLNTFKGLKQDRVCGMDVLPDILKRAEKENKSVYFYGTTDEVLDAIRLKAGTELPSLRISGTYSPPFRTLTPSEKEEIILKINSSKSDFVFVALGCPKQEKWMAEHTGKIHACMLGLGQAFHTYAGLEKRLPKWMRDLSLEWAYRLAIEPRRLWKRYLKTNSTFIWLTLKYAFGGSRTTEGPRLKQ